MKFSYGIVLRTDLETIKEVRETLKKIPNVILVLSKITVTDLEFREKAG